MGLDLKTLAEVYKIISFIFVLGHTVVSGNEYADRLADMATMKIGLA